MTSSKWKWLSKVFLLSMMILGMVISISSSNLFLAWFGLELKMFGMMPFLILNSNLEENKNELNVAIYYFIIQILGSMLFSWGSIMGKNSMVGLMGLLMKMGVSPFFWWVPSMLSRMDWISLLMLSTMQKMPSMILIRMSFDLSFSSSLYICLSGLIMSMMGMNFSSKNFKVLFAWSSVGNMSLLLLLLTLFLNLGLFFFVMYMSGLMGMVFYILNTKEKFMSSSKNKKKSVKKFIVVSLFVLVFSGLPPLLGFMTKVLFFSGISLSESDLMIKQMQVLDKNNYMVDYPLFKVLGSWKLNMMISMILIFQVVAYMKMFMKVYTSSLMNLEGSSRNLKYKMDLKKYFLVMMLVSMMPLLIL